MKIIVNYGGDNKDVYHYPDIEACLKDIDLSGRTELYYRASASKRSAIYGGDIEGLGIEFTFYAKKHKFRIFYHNGDNALVKGGHFYATTAMVAETATQLAKKAGFSDYAIERTE